MAKKNKYEDLSNRVIGLVGEKENITFFTHCVTRLRLTVKDKSLVNVKEIEKIEGVIGCQWVGDQFQIIIGQAVSDVYKLICQKTGLAQEDTVSDDVKKESFSLKKGLSDIFTNIAACIVPLLPIMIGVGMIKVIILVGQSLGWISMDSPTSIVINFVADAGFYFFPVFIGATASRKFGANIAISMLLGAMLIHPTFISMVVQGTPMSVFGLTIKAGNYANAVFPSILAIYVLSKLEKVLNKYTPEILRSICVPLFSILIMIPITFCFIAPLGANIGVVLSAIINFIYVNFGGFGVAVFACLQPIMVLTGMHVAMVPYGLQSFQTYGFLPNVIGTLINNFNQGAASLAVALKTKDKSLKSTAISAATTAIIAGVSEPAMYGINLRLKKPFYLILAGNFIGALVGGLLKVYVYIMGAGTNGLFAFPAYLEGGASNVLYAILACVVGFVATFLLVYFSYKEEIN